MIPFASTPEHPTPIAFADLQHLQVYSHSHSSFPYKPSRIRYIKLSDNTYANYSNYDKSLQDSKVWRHVYVQLNISDFVFPFEVVPNAPIPQNPQEFLTDSSPFPKAYRFATSALNLGKNAILLASKLCTEPFLSKPTSPPLTMKIQYTLRIIHDTKPIFLQRTVSPTFPPENQRPPIWTYVPAIHDKIDLSPDLPQSKDHPILATVIGRTYLPNSNTLVIDLGLVDLDTSYFRSKYTWEEIYTHFKATSWTQLPTEN